MQKFQPAQPPPPPGKSKRVPSRWPCHRVRTPDTNNLEHPLWSVERRVRRAPCHAVGPFACTQRGSPPDWCASATNQLMALWLGLEGTVARAGGPSVGARGGMGPLGPPLSGGRRDCQAGAPPTNGRKKAISFRRLRHSEDRAPLRPTGCPGSLGGGCSAHRAQVSAGAGKPPHGLGVCLWMPLVSGTGYSPVSGTADPRSSQTGQVIRGLR